MHVVATPVVIELPVGEPAVIAVSITNTGDVIDAYDVEAFGLDPAWVTVFPARLSLFPAEVGIVEVTVDLPADVPAGNRTVAVHVRSQNDRNEFALAQVDLDVGTRSRTTLRVDPVTITGGNAASFQLIVANEGNATVQARPGGEDPEDVFEMTFEPPTVVLPPGRREIVRADVRGGRPWFGQPKPRVIVFSLGDDAAPAMATFVQRPRIGRWMLSLLGLITAAAVFAVVLSTVADRLVEESSVDPALLDRALLQGRVGAGGMASVTPSKMTGRVVVASTGQGVAGVTADLFGAGNGTVPVATAASDDTGTFTFGRLPGGRYRVRVRGAGFSEQWYQRSLTFADATDIDVDEGAEIALEDIEIGGRPGSIAGEVVAPDPTGAVAKLVVPGLADTEANALVDEVTVSADGSFEFSDVPSPGNYQLIVDKAGFATQTRAVKLGAAEELDGVKVVLREGDGIIAGRVSTPGGGPLGGVDIVATTGELEFQTASLTLDDVGAFTVRTLPTPASYTLTFQRAGFEPATRTVELSSAQEVSGLAITMAPTAGSIEGSVTSAAGGLGGATVTVTGAGDVEMRTTTASVGNVGAYSFGALPVPATYTVTFSKDGYVAQTRLVELGGAGGLPNAAGVDARLVSSTALIRGVVRGVDGRPVAGATVVLNAGTGPRQVLSADDPLGRFEFANVAPGAYTLTASLTGTSPAVRLVNVIANDVRELDIRLEAQASLTGRVVRVDNGVETPYSGAVVRLYPPSRFPGPPAADLPQVVLGPDGTYTFPTLTAPGDYVVAVFNAATASDALDSRLVQTQPSAAVVVPVISIFFSGAVETTTTTAAPVTTTAPNPTVDTTPVDTPPVNTGPGNTLG
jgi:hypothetical protein